LRRFRDRRRRIGALALLPLAALTTTTAIALAATSTSTARIDASKASVRIGNQVTLRGSFEAPEGHPVLIEHRPRGTPRWRAVSRTTTNAQGAYRVRISPRRSGDWRARLAEPQAAEPSASGSTLEETSPETGAAQESVARRIAVRSRTRVEVARRHLTAGRQLRIDGRVRPAGRRKVTVRVGGRTIATRTRPNGRFSVSWRARGLRSHRVSARAGANRRARGSRFRAGRVTVYRPAPSSWYGPGLYGNRTACGQTLTTSTQGVAHRSIPCGTKLRLRYRGRSVAVRVIDRGPYVAGRELDLTYATKRRLGFGSTGSVLMSR
jgi:rare lipoprotein A